MKSKLRILNSDEFAPFGDVFEPPPVGERTHLARSFQNLRDRARIDCYINHRAPTVLPYSVSVMERHSFSSQAFMPLQVSRYVVAVAPSKPPDQPDLSRLMAFVASGEQAVSYRAGVWHCPLIALDKTGQVRCVDVEGRFRRR